MEKKRKPIEHPPEIKAFIKKHSHLWWWVPEEKKEKLSLDSVVEAILNYGDIDDIKELFDLIGIEKAAEIFYRRTSGFRTNYFPLVKHFFKLYFDRHVQGNTNQRTN
jgi:hypothetical protein